MTNERKKILLVEDNNAEANLTNLVYADLGIENEILHFNDGSDLLKNLPSIPLCSISYILLDLNMPKINGYQVLKNLAAHDEWRKLPVIIFSNSAFEEDVNTCYDLGANAYVSKPMDIHHLQKAIHAIHECWGILNVTPFFNLNSKRVVFG